MYNTNTTGFFQQVPGFNPNFMFGYQNNNPQMNTMEPQINTPQMNMSAINQLYTPQPPTNP